MQITAELLTTPPDARRAAFEVWVNQQEDRGRYADELAAALLAMEPVPHKPATGNGDTELICFLEADGMRHPLAELAEAASPASRAILLACASTSSALTGDLADLAYVYARDALLADVSCAMGSQAYEDSLYGYPEDVFDDILTWHDERPAVAAIALAAARKVSPNWSPEEQKRLADLEAILSWPGRAPGLLR
jgi:hypothetical protein